MKKRFLFFVIFYFMVSTPVAIFCNGARNIINLDGKWEFEQTEKAIPPDKFTHIIPVPGLIDLAEPKIEQYEKYFNGTQQPRYNWYRYTFSVSPENQNKFAVLNILKSQFNTQVLLNGYDLGTYMECNTPIECNLTEFISYKEKNVLLIRVGERAWLPKQSATGVDREKYADIPGIWDDVFITFTGPLRVERTLILPDLRNSKATFKILIENHAKIIDRSMYLTDINGIVSVHIREKKSGQRVSDVVSEKVTIRCQNQIPVSFELSVKNPHLWSPEDPFLYEAVVSITAEGKSSDQVETPFGMRDFKSVGRMFHLNGQQYRLLGSTINLYRFFEDRERAGLPWNKDWVKKMLVDIPKSLQWNAFRMCIGLAPKFWYDYADEYGILIQNEYPMWQVRGWNEQIDKEYTDWVWTDGNHPSIIIWDAMNELKHDYIGNVVIPKLKKLDPARIWDAGYMTGEDMILNEMDEPHYYPLSHGWWQSDDRVKQSRELYRFGNLFRKHSMLGLTRYEGVPMVLNEYGWLWLNRDGTPAIRTKGYFGPEDTPPKTKDYEYFNAEGKQEFLNRDNYEYFLGLNATVKDRREFQAYMMGVQTEAIRSSRNLAGVLSFCYLTNNKGYTGDWFIDSIKDLVPGPTLKWMYHCFAPFAVFIDVEDGRYLKNPKTFEPAKEYAVNLLGINDTGETKSGKVVFKIINAKGDIINEQSSSISVDAFWETLLPLVVKFPETPGCYLLLSELHYSDESIQPQLSRRYVRVGPISDSNYPEVDISLPPNWPK